MILCSVRPRIKTNRCALTRPSACETLRHQPRKSNINPNARQLGRMRALPVALLPSQERTIRHGAPPCERILRDQSVGIRFPLHSVSRMQQQRADSATAGLTICRQRTASGSTRALPRWKNRPPSSHVKPEPGLREAVQAGDFCVGSSLLAGGNRPNRSVPGVDALMKAKRRKRTSGGIVELLRCMQPPIYEANRMGCSGLSLATAQSMRRQTSCAALGTLLQCGANPLEKDGVGLTDSAPRTEGSTQ